MDLIFFFFFFLNFPSLFLLWFAIHFVFNTQGERYHLGDGSGCGSSGLERGEKERKRKRKVELA